MNLNWEDLINGAESKKHLNNATSTPFARKYSKKSIVIGKRMHNEAEALFCSHLKRSFQLFRLLLRAGEILFSKDNYYRLLRYTNEFCAEYLVYFAFLVPNESREHEYFRKPFSNVQTIFCDGN